MNRPHIGGWVEYESANVSHGETRQSVSTENEITLGFTLCHTHEQVSITVRS